MSLKKITLALVAASVVMSATAPAMAFPNGPKDFQNKPTPKFPGPKGPGGFKTPPKGQGPKGGHNHNHDAAFGAMMGIGLLTAAAIAASAQDDGQECWKEKHQGEIVTVCVAD